MNPIERLLQRILALFKSVWTVVRGVMSGQWLADMRLQDRYGQPGSA